MIRLDDEQRRRRLARRHRLIPSARAATVTQVVDDVVAMHSSDPLTVFLGIGQRLRDPSVEMIEAALYDARDVVRHHAMRSTLWVMTPTVAQWAHAACTRKIAASERARTLTLLDGDEAWLDDAIERMCAVLRDSDVPLTTRELGRLLPDLDRTIRLAAGTKNETTASGRSRALLQAGFEGSVLRGPPAGSWISSQYAWALSDRWLDIDWDAFDEETGRRELVGAWLARFGPATLTDLTWWSGMTKTAIRTALDGLETVPVELEQGEGIVLANDIHEEEDPGPWVGVLPGLDPTAMGWKERDWYLDPTIARSVTDRMGNIGPTVWVDGRILGGWVQRPDGSIATDVGDLGVEHGRLLDAEIERITTFMGATRAKVRFPAPSQKALLV